MMAEYCAKLHAFVRHEYHLFILCRDLQTEIYVVGNVVILVVSGQG
jgi:hypothetical protein